MEMQRLYADISERTGGSIYIGVIGPVRTGKSTFIKRFMQAFVVPNIENEHQRARALDELPQSGAGRTVMTAEPKFIPEEAVAVCFGESSAKIRMVDCVGYMVPGALGQFENEMPRMVSTPWFDHEIPMTEAAEIGTRKVITEHATVGVMVTTDGSVTDLPREEYAEAEARVIRELQGTGKPFVVVVNSREPDGEAACAVAEMLRKEYDVTAITADVMHMDEAAIRELLLGMLREFPLRKIDVFMPDWCEALTPDHWLKDTIFKEIAGHAGQVRRVRDLELLRDLLRDVECVDTCSYREIHLGDGSASLELAIPRSFFYEIIGEKTGLSITSDCELLPILADLSAAKAAYEKFADAIAEVESKGYGIVTPEMEELTLETPEIVQQGGQFGVRLRASAPSIHMIKANIETTVSPIVGSEKQSEELVEYLLREFEGDESRIWSSNIFGKSLHELVNEGLAAKLAHMPEAARAKLRETLERIINEGSSGLICIIL
ncbi:MAG: stage IV sporulation protein A [Ruminococcaceae bacterium]|nr:stage IV sporulation protein A [Oscillospiraceae bacterium]